MTGRERRLRFEEDVMTQRFGNRKDITVRVTGRNAAGCANRYRVVYHIRCMYGVENVEHLFEEGYGNAPLFADRFEMDITIPAAYPSIDALPVFMFRTHDDEGNAIPHPWHPNIRWFGQMAGRVCLNMPDTYTELAWGVSRVAQYLRYEIYHAVNEPPFPEDLKVAEWVLASLESEK